MSQKQKPLTDFSHPPSKEAALKPDVPSQPDIYARVTNKILTDLEQGHLTWRKPWHSEQMAGQVMRPLRWNNIPYTGINTLGAVGHRCRKRIRLALLDDIQTG
jgi:antirestriction protein ArdC